MTPPPISPHAELEERLRFETLIADLSSQFINLPPGDVDREIREAQRRMCDILNLDLAGLWQRSDEVRGTFVLTHLYRLEQGPQPPEPMTSREHFPWHEQQMLAGRTIAVRSMEELPAEAARDRKVYEHFGIKSVVAVPLTVGGGPPVGILGFNTTRAERDWPDQLVRRLQLVAQIFANALARKRTDQALRESEQRFRLLIEQAPEAILVMDLDHNRLVEANAQAERLFGCSRQDLLAAGLQHFYTPEQPDGQPLAESVPAHNERARRGETVLFERTICNASGQRLHCEVRLVRLPTAERNLFRASFVDITERKRAEEAFRATEARLAAGSDLAGLGYYEADYGARTCFLDDRFRAICGVPPELQQGLAAVQFWMEHVHPDDRQLVSQEREKLHDAKVDRICAEYRYLHPSNGQRWLHHSARFAGQSATGGGIRTYGVVRDITPQKQAEEALLKSYAEIERLKDHLQAESDYLKAEIKVTQPHAQVIGRSAAIREVLSQAEQVAPTDSSVLIYGETGTGKELVAQIIHRLSSRASRVMVKVNCAALPSTLVESELFGREKGAFTGALMRQVGRFEVADGSTIFLDEVGELSVEVQAKLLRVLQEGQFERLGSPRTIKINVRLIAATNRDLAEEVRKGRFRSDLYYRLNVFPIRVPPLRDRTEDIPLLVWAALEEFSFRMGKRITQVPRKTMEMLQRHPWLGNVRELRNVIEHSTIITTGDTLKVPMLEQAATEEPGAQTLADCERDHILKALEKTAWRIKGPNGAAAALALNPATLYHRMRKLGIPNHRQKQAAT